MSLIPKIIHQTWKDGNLPDHFRELIDSWKEFHIDWEFKLWTDEMNRNFIKNEYPHFLETYDSYPKNIQRVDAVRYFILLNIGGVFIDVDFECLKNIEPLLENKSCVFGLEPIEHCQSLNKDMIISNAFMACKPKHEFFKLVCHEINKIPLKNHITNIDILETTGPFMLTEVYRKYNNKENIELLSSDKLFPLNLPETRNLITDNNDEFILKKISNSYAIHLFWGSWW